MVHLIAGRFIALSKAYNVVSSSSQGLWRTAIRHMSSDVARPIGFIGLGNMGGPMAVNLATKGKYDLIVYDVIEENIEKVCSGVKGAGGGMVTTASSPGDVAVRCGSAGGVTTIVTMLPSNPHVTQVYLDDKDGILSNLKGTGHLLIDSSTIEPGLAAKIGKAASDQSTTYMDAPVSGGVLAAKDALLTFMVGGPKFDEAKSLLQHMGKNVIHCGQEVGCGEAAKICNNMLLAISMIGTSEAMHLGVKLGLSPDLLASVLNTSSGRCWASDTYNPCPGVLPNVPSSRDYEGGFGTALMTKDLMLPLFFNM